MADPVKVEDKEVPSYLEMSDEEILNMPAPGFNPDPVVQEPVAEVVSEKETIVSEKATTEEPEKEEEEPGEAASPEGVSDAGKPAAADTTEATAGEPKAEAKKEEKKEPSEPAAPDYEAEYKKILAPFKANGKDIQVESVDDAIALMQMGANYAKKMAALKPNLKLLKMLENNKLLSEEKLSFLIDLDKKDPGAINKLVKDSGIDPMDLSAEKAGTYKQTAYAVDDQELELDAVLGEIQDSPTYTKTLDVVGNKWDTASKQVIAKTPQLLKIIDDHVSSGIYDVINKEIERETMLGRLKGMSNIEAYKAVGDAIQARGGFNHLFKQQAATPAAPEIVVP
jgi:hypothetical protein